MYDTIIFDLGAVLIDWNPRYLYKQVFVTQEAMEHFLGEICTSAWNEEQDAGRSLSEATNLLSGDFPEYKTEIDLYYAKWRTMLAGPIEESVFMLEQLKKSGKYRLLALTNWSAETFPLAMEIFEFLQWFDGILVSGTEKMKKPDPAIFELLLTRYNIARERAVFIDDNLHNVLASRKLGIETIHFKNAEDCKKKLVTLLNPNNGSGNIFQPEST